MRTEQLRALAAKADYALDAETEAFFRLVEHSMRNDIRSKLLELEDYFDRQKDEKAASIAWACSLLVKRGMDIDSVLLSIGLTKT